MQWGYFLVQLVSSCTIEVFSCAVGLTTFPIGLSPCTMALLACTAGLLGCTTVVHIAWLFSGIDNSLNMPVQLCKYTDWLFLMVLWLV